MNVKILVGKYEGKTFEVSVMFPDESILINVIGMHYEYQLGEYELLK